MLILTPEEKLIVASVKIHPTKEELDYINSLLPLVEDWESFCQTIIERSLAPLFFKKIPSLPDSSLIPATIRQKLQQTYYLTLSRGMVMHNAFTTISKAMNDNDIRVIVLKGLYLSETLYHDIGLRQFSDIDLLVKPEDGTKCLQVLSTLGYRQQADVESELESKLEVVHYDPMVKDGIAIEVHVKLHLNNESYQLNPSELWKNAVQCTISGQTVYSLDIYDLLIHICVHANRHMSIGHVQFNGFSDIVNVVEENKADFDWQQLHDRCILYNSEKEVYSLLVLLHKYMGLNIPADFLSKYSFHLKDKEEELFVKYLRGYRGFRSGMAKHFSNFGYLHTGKDRLLYALKIVFPSKKFMVDKFTIRHTWQLPFYYLYRWYLGLKGTVRYLFSR